MSYGSVYVAQVALGAKDQHVIKTFHDAQSYKGPSLIIAYSHCIAHGIDMANGLHHQKLAVESGYWPLYRFDPRLSDIGENPFQLDSDAPAISLDKYLYTEARFSSLRQTHPEHADDLLREVQDDINKRWSYYDSLAHAAQPALAPQA